MLGTILPLSFIYDTLTNILKYYTNLFNESYIRKILQSEQNLVVLDLEQALVDIFEHYKQFGFDDTFASGCVAGTLSRVNQICNQDSKYLDKKHHIFGDIIHPSAETHQALANYILAVLNAPVQYSSIAVQQIFILNTINQQIEKQILSTLNQPLRLNSFKLLFNYSFSFNQPQNYQGIHAKKSALNSLDVGYLYQNTEKNTLALMLTLNYAHIKSYENYRYAIQMPILSFFNIYRFNKNLWSSFALGLSKNWITNIERFTLFYKGGFTEIGRTTAISNYLNFKLGYLFSISDVTNINIYLGITRNYFKIKGFSEKANHSTTMSFGKIDFKQQYGTLGFYLFHQKESLNFFSSLRFNHSPHNSYYIIESGIKKFNKKYQQPIHLFDKNWINLELGLSKSFTKKSNLHFSLGFLKQQHVKKPQYNIQLGWSYKP